MWKLFLVNVLMFDMTVSKRLLKVTDRQSSRHCLFYDTCWHIHGSSEAVSRSCHVAVSSAIILAPLSSGSFHGYDVFSCQMETRTRTCSRWLVNLSSWYNTFIFYVTFIYWQSNWKYGFWNHNFLLKIILNIYWFSISSHFTVFHLLDRLIRYFKIGNNQPNLRPNE